ncbi:MAG: septal ring lytic transglycosylase RlpA family protein [Steroidobacteraceae bacterium]
MVRIAFAAAVLLIGSAVAHAEVGIASNYCDRITANGEHMRCHDRDNPTAAHRTLPFGTRVGVTNKRNGRSVTVRINDRGPFIRGRIIDLSPAAARAIGCGGTCPVALSW